MGLENKFPLPSEFLLTWWPGPPLERSNCVKWLLQSRKKEPLCAHYFHLNLIIIGWEVGVRKYFIVSKNHCFRMHFENGNG